jgi:hypothetical protein
MDLSSFKEIDPDEIYNKSDFKITFFYLPEKDEIIYSKDGFQTHEDLLNPDPNNGSDKIFDAVFPNTPPGKKKPLRSRGKVLANTDRIVGRFGALHNDMVVALWNRLDHPAIKAFEAKLLKTFPNLGKVDIIIVGSDKEPRFMHQGTQDYSKKKVNGDEPEKEPEPIRKKFTIDGNDYTFDELRELRLLIHNVSGMAKNHARSVLCHPDMKKYDELNGLIPGNCPPSRSSNPEPVSPRKSRLRDYGPLIRFGESFKDFVKYGR